MSIHVLWPIITITTNELASFYSEIQRKIRFIQIFSLDFCSLAWPAVFDIKWIYQFAKPSNNNREKKTRNKCLSFVLIYRELLNSFRKFIYFVVCEKRFRAEQENLTQSRNENRTKENERTNGKSSQHFQFSVLPLSCVYTKYDWLDHICVIIQWNLIDFCELCISWVIQLNRSRENCLRKIFKDK